MSKHEFLKEVSRIIKEGNENIEKSITEAFREEKKEVNPNADSKIFSVFGRALRECNTKLIIGEINEDNKKWRTLYKRHEQWKRIALDDPLISEYLKDVIRESTSTKTILRDNSLTKELAISLKDSIDYIIKNKDKRFKKKDAIRLSFELLKKCFPKNSSLKGITEEAFVKALQKT